jgi:ABC-type transport system involved in cytochrome bd biosynthesis fused ATPase/permease subunit
VLDTTILAIDAGVAAQVAGTGCYRRVPARSSSARAASVVLLDEPTYGLDEQHRHALLDRIASLSLCDQILVITHHAMGKAPSQRIVVDKQAAA